MKQGHRIGSRPRLAVIHSRYGWYQRSYFDSLVAVFDVNLLTLFDDRPDDPMPEDLVRATKRISLGMNGVRVRHYGPISFITLVNTVWDLIRRCDVVLTSTQNPVHSKVAWILGRLLRRPVAVIVEQWQDYPPAGLMKRAYNGLSVALMRSADRCFVHGEYAKAFVESKGVDPGKVRVYPHVNADLGKRDPLPRGNRPCTFVYVGRFVPVKGVDVLIEAMRRVTDQGHDARLVLVGDGPLRGRLESDAESLGQAVSFRGRVSPRELPEVIRESDVLVLPSLQLDDAYEGWGLVVGEAASVGRAIIVSDVVGSAPELVHDGVNGRVVHQGDPEALAAAMIEMAGDSRLCERMGRESRELFEAYCDPSQCGQLLLELVRQ